MSLQKEEWLPVKIEGQEIKGKYLVSNFGRIKSFTSNENGKYLKGTKIEGYPAIRFRTEEGKLITRYVHHLVAAHFLAPKKEHDRVILHLDYDKENNSMTNLKWADKDEQIQHRMRGPNHRRGVITNSKLTEGQVRQIKMLLKNKRTRLKMIAKQFGITHTQINRIKSGENWSHIRV